MKSRTFNRKTHDVVTDRSDWTDTPAERERKLTCSQSSLLEGSVKKRKVGPSTGHELDKSTRSSIAEYNASDSIITHP